MIFKLNLSFQKVFFSILLILLPFFYYPIVADPAHTPIFTYVLGGILFSLFFYNRSFQFSMDVFSILIVLLLTIGVLSIYFISNNSEAILEFNRILFLFICYVFFKSTLTLNEKFSIYIINGFLYIGAVYALFGLIEYFSFYDRDAIHHGLYQMRAHIGHKNLLSIYLATTLPLSIYLINIFHLSKLKFVYFIYLILIITTIILTESRVGMIGLICGVCPILYYLFRVQKRSFYLSFKYKLVCVILFLIFCFYKLDSLKYYLKRASSIVTIGAQRDENMQSVQERFVLWDKSIELIKDAPWAGVGLGQWKLQILSKNINATRSKFGNIIFQQPHNDYLWVASEYGILGGIFYVLLFLLSIFHLLKSKDEFNYLIAVSILVLFVCSIFDFPKERPIILCLMGFLFALTSIRLNKSFFKINNWGRYSFLFVIFLSLYFWTYRYKSEVIMSKLLMDRGDKNQDHVIILGHKLLNRSSEYDPTSTPINFYIGEAFFFKKELDSSVYYFKQALRYSPYHLYTWSNLGTVYKLKNDEMRANFCWEKAISISNDFAEPRMNLAFEYLKQNDDDLAIKTIHFDIEKEDVKKYNTQITYLLHQFILHSINGFDDNLYRENAKHLLQDNGRLEWLYMTYCKDTLDFKTQLINDISYSIHHPKPKKN